MATPMVLFPQTNEQRAVEKRVLEMGAGVSLKGDSVEAIREAFSAILNQKSYGEMAAECSRDFREAPGPKGAAEFVETAPHLMPEEDKRLLMLDMLPGLLQLLFWVAAVALIIVLPRVTSVKWWILAIAANIIFIPFKQLSGKIIAGRAFS